MEPRPGVVHRSDGDEVAEAPDIQRPDAAGHLFRSFAAGIVIGVTESLIAVSFAALIFSGGLSTHLAPAVGYVLVGAVIVVAVLALLSTVRGTVGSVQDIPAAILALAAAAIAGSLPAEDPTTFVTVIVAVGFTTVLAGVFFLLLGALRLGGFVRFVPFPVVGGFLAGTGWLLVVGGTEVIAGAPLSLATLGEFLRLDTAVRVAPALTLAVVLLLVSRRSERPLMIPGVLIAAFVGFHMVFVLTGASLDEAAETGWLLGPFDGGSLLQPLALTTVAGADWPAILDQIASIGTLLVFAVLALLLNASGIELALKRDGDLDRELRAAGIANVAAGLAGGMPGYHALSLTALADKMWARTRYVGLVAAAVCLVILLVGGRLLSLFPTLLVGGVLVFVGLAFLTEWLYDTRDRMPRSDHFVLIAIVVVIATVGFLEGVAVGVLLAMVLFVVNYSRNDVVKHELSGATFRSKKDRPPAQRDVLRQVGDRIAVLELQGYLFFGTAHGLLERVRERVRERDHAELGFLVLDLRRVRDLDTSAVMSFTKIQQLAAAEGFEVVYTGLYERTFGRLRKDPLRPEQSVLVFDDLDRGLEWCEDRLLGEEGAVAEADAADLFVALDGAGVDAGAGLGRYLERLELGVGDVLLRRGEDTADVYFLESGQLTVELPREGRTSVRLRTLLPGSIVGEASFYLGTPRIATVVSDAPSVVLRLSGHAMREMEHASPELALRLHRWLAGLLAERLADTLDTVDALLE